MTENSLTVSQDDTKQHADPETWLVAVDAAIRG